MTSVDQEQAGIVPVADGSRKIKTAIVRLAHAYRYAHYAHCSPWEFAVEIESLAADGVTTTDLRWLVNKGYIEHACEITRCRDRSRRFRPCHNLGFCRRACFVLTEPGRRELTLVSPQEQLLSADPQPLECYANDRHVPSWDADRRVLCVGDIVVKQFRVPAPNQEAILVAFEEEGWPTAIDDPLPYRPGRDSKHRLRSTVQTLNARQNNHLLRFRGNGTGTRVLWELIGNRGAQFADEP
jgi:hypothetical protein